MPAHSPITIVLAGTTEYTRWCAETLVNDPSFVITHVLTPIPKLVGRKQILTENPLHQWATANSVPGTLIEERVDRAIKAELSQLPQPALLLVVDFGYFIPRWLLEWPTVGPLNIHPSQLPRWRGSSPGQFPLLYGDPTSAITLMSINEEFDAGPILAQLPFDISPHWTAHDYYQHAFSLMMLQLPALIKKYVKGQLPPRQQPTASPTAVARKLTRDDGYVSWELVQRLVAGSQQPSLCDFNEVSPILLDAFSVTGNIYQVIERSIRAFTPWPGLWTEVPTIHGQKRLKLLSARLQHDKNATTCRLEPLIVQLEGKQPAPWHQVQEYLKFTK